MSLDGKLLARARQRLAGTKEKNAALLEARRAEIYAALPSVKAIDGELRGLFADVLALTLKEGGDPTEALRRVEERSLALCAEKGEILAANGYAPDYLEDIASCRKCGDTGYTPDGKMCACLKALYEEEQAKELASLMKQSENSFAAFDLNYYTGADREHMAAVLDYCRGYAAGFGPDAPNLLFRGDTGLGKTFLSGCVAAAVAQRGFSVDYETVHEAFSAFEDARFRRDAEAGERSGRVLSCDLLILDDLGTELSTSFTQSTLYHIINSRLVGGKKTIISTNMSAKDITEAYTPAIASRLLGEYDTLLFRGKDIRQIKKQHRYD